jgi:hypothetical protein
MPPPSTKKRDIDYFIANVDSTQATAEWMAIKNWY